MIYRDFKGIKLSGLGLGAMRLPTTGDDASIDEAAAMDMVDFAMELDIPHLISLYNDYKFTGGGFIAPMALGALDEDKRPASCIGCGSCAAVCPQQIDIPSVLADFSELKV